MLMSDMDQVLINNIERGIRDGTLRLSGFEKLVYEAGKAAGRKIRKP